MTMTDAFKNAWLSKAMFLTISELSMASAPMFSKMISNAGRTSELFSNSSEQLENGMTLQISELSSILREGTFCSMSENL